MEQELAKIQLQLQKIISESGQSRYDRGVVTGQSVPKLVECKSKLLSILQGFESPLVYDLLSLVDECLLKYRSATDWLDKKCSLEGTVSKKDRKRRSLLELQIANLKSLPLPSEFEADLLNYLQEMDRSSEPSLGRPVAVEQWLEHNVQSLAIRDAVSAYFRKNGLDSDHAILKHLQDRTN